MFKVIILLVLFCVCIFAQTKDCTRCIEMVDTLGSFCKKNRNECNELAFTDFIGKTCKRFFSVDQSTCSVDVDLAKQIWSVYDGSSAEKICQKAKLCPAKIHSFEHLKNTKFGKFAEFKAKFNKKYSNVFEETKRANIFYNNLKRIEKLNKYANDNKMDTQFGINEYADMSHYEWKLLRLSKFEAVQDANAPVVTEVKNAQDIPTAFDWRTKGAVTGVKNQGQCGSCWSFSTTGNIEGQWFLAGHTLTSLSEQNLVDCDHECMMYENQNTCDQGCDGGLMPNAFTYVIKNKGIDTEASYPYEAVDGTCHFSSSNIGATISNFTMVSHNETVMAEYLYAHGPTSIAADAAEWQFYVGGVFDLPCGHTLDHGILIVGYGVETDIIGLKKDYWIVKNSWGASWGEKGYLKIKRGDCKCGLCLFPCSSIV